VPGRAYNLGGGSRVSLNEVLDIIGRVTGQPLHIERGPAQKGDVRDTYADTSLARTDLGFQPTVSLADGLAEEYRWLASASVA
jgi:UDP-glucose 4-epimerase